MSSWTQGDLVPVPSTRRRQSSAKIPRARSSARITGPASCLSLSWTLSRQYYIHSGAATRHYSELLLRTLCNEIHTYPATSPRQRSASSYLLSLSSSWGLGTRVRRCNAHRCWCCSLPSHCHGHRQTPASFLFGVAASQSRRFGVNHTHTRTSR